MKNDVADYLHGAWRHTHFGFFFQAVRGPRRGLRILACISIKVNEVHRFIMRWGVKEQASNDGSGANALSRSKKASRFQALKIVKTISENCLHPVRVII